MNRRIWEGLCASTILGLGQVPFLGTAAVWMGSDRLGGTCVIFGVTGVVTGTVLSIFHIDNYTPNPLPSRKVRRQLKKERERIEFDRRLRELEREAGL